jgi:RNA:NAD 2'-phosphotransferase (TPT1/KptA family)
MNSAAILAVVQTVNSLLQLAKDNGVGWVDLRGRISKAHAEGREFGAADIADLQARDDQERAAGEESLAKARQRELALPKPPSSLR